MHILIIPSWYPNTYNDTNGSFFKEQAEALAKQDTKVGVIALTQVTIQDIFKRKKLHFEKNFFTKNGVITSQEDYFVFPKIYRKLTICKKRREAYFKKLFTEYISKHGMPDIVHLHSFFYGHLTKWIKKNYNIPYVVTEHSTTFARGLLSHSEIEYATDIYQNSDKNFAVSNEFSTLLQDKTGIAFDYLPNIVNVNFFKDTNQTKKTKKNNTIRFINIGYLVPKKAQSMLIEAFNMAFDSKEDVELIIVGEGTEYNHLKNLIQSLKLEKSVQLYGKASREEVRDLLLDSDIFVLSSLYETFGVVLIEALSCGLPLVATKCGGPESIIVDKKIGLLSDINVSSLAKAMQEIYHTIEHYDKAYLKNYVEKNFSEEAVSNRLISTYKEVIKS